MWELFISSESENSRFGEFGGDLGEGGALVLPWETKADVMGDTRADVRAEVSFWASLSIRM